MDISRKDGTVIITVNMDTSKADKDLAKLKKDIEKTENALSGQEAKKSPLVAQAKELRQKMEEARAEVRKYGEEWKAGVIGADGKQVAAQERLSQIEAEYSRITAEIGKINDKIGDAVAKLDQMEREAGDLQVQIDAAAKSTFQMGEFVNKADLLMEKMLPISSVLEKMRNVFSGLAKKILSFIKSVPKHIANLAKIGMSALEKVTSGVLVLAKRLNVFSRLSDSLSGTLKRLGSIIKRAFVFSVIYKGLALLKEQVSSYLLVNDQFSDALSRIKGAFLTAFQPIYDVVVPALTTLLNILSRVIAAVTQFTASLFGTTAK